MKVYKCDGESYNNGKCDNQIEKLDGWLSIGSESDKLFIENNLPNRRLISLSNHADLHFCSKNCLIDFLFADNLC